MQIQLDYDKVGLTISVPDKNLVKVLKMKKVPPLPDPSAALGEKLISPLGSEGLNNLASKSKTVCIVVSDKTRPVPNRVILPVILNLLEDSEIKRENITILIATGVHSPTEGKDLIELLGEDIVENYKVVNHLAQDDKSHTFLGETSSGTPVYVNSIYYKLDLKILTGFIEPHFMTGFSGGRKSICPGIISIETIRVHHSPKFLESPFSAPGILEGNPCHEEALEIAKMAGVDFIVNVTLDNKKRITGIFAGDLEGAHLAGVEFCGYQVSDHLEEAVDVAITSGGGYPLDCDFYQTVKGLVGALDIVKEEGTIIIASGCRDGIGSPEFKELLFEMETPAQFLEMINQDNYFTIDQWEVEELLKVLKKTKVKLYSTGLSSEEVVNCHIQPISSVEESIEETLNEYGKDTRIAVIPNGPYLLARLEKERNCTRN